MSTVSQVRPSPASKYETFVEEQLARARNRIRLLDLAAAGLGFLIVTLGYGLLMVVLDRLLELPSLVRQAAFGLYLVGAVVYVGFTLGRVLLRRINPLYAAQQVEHILPDAKNSVVNYLDLREQDLPAAIRGAVSHRAAKDLARADLDQAISTRRTGWLGGIVGGLCLGLAILFFLGPPQFFSLLRRAFAPFTETTIATRTQLGIMQPEGGNCTVAVGRAVPVLVSVFGHIPESNRSDSLRLLYRHQPTDPYTERPLERGDSRNEWGTVVPAAEVQNGFWYKVVGGDAETPEYRVQVRSNPLVETIEVKYHFRPYLNRPDLTTNEPNLEALRGTEVTLTARTNRDIREGHLEFVGEARPLVAEKVAEDAHALRFKFTLDKDGTYRIWFTSQEGERNAEPMPYSIRVKKDNPPRVEVTKLDPPPGQPAADKPAEPKDEGKVVELPANGLLKVEGVARDDYGIVGMKLRAEGDVQFARTYREGKSFRLENGNYPLKLDYKDFVDLSQLKLANGQPLRPGLEFECWLEATDNCDYPEANVGQSERFKVRIKEVEKDPQKQQQQRQKAQEEQKKHNEKQDQNLQKESQERQQQEQQQQQQQQQQSEDKPKDNPQQDKKNQDSKDENGGQGQKKPEQGNEPKSDNNTQSKDGNSAQNQHEGKQTDSKAGNSQGEKDKQLENQVKQLDRAIQEKEQENKSGQENQNGQGNQSRQEDKAAPPNSQGSKAGQQSNQDNTAGRQNHQDNKPGQQNGQETKAGQENKPGSQKNQENKAGQQNGSENQAGQPNGQGGKSGQQKDQENKPGQQNGQENRAGQKNNKAGQQNSPENKAGQENKPGQQNGPKSKTGQQSGQENKAGQNNKTGQQDGQGNKPEQPNGQKNQAGQENKAGQQQGQGDKTGQENPAGQENKPGQQNGQENKGGQKNQSGQKNGQESKNSQENSAGQKGKGGQENKIGQENKAGQKNKATQRNGQEGKGGPENKAGQQNGQGDKTGQESKTGQQRAQENKSGQENKTGQPNGQTNQGNQQKGQETKAGQSNTKGGNKGQEKGTGNKNGNNRKPSIDELINALKDGNAKVRQDAAKKLEDAKERVTDPALKKAIEDALKESKEGKSGGEKAGQSGQKSESNKGQNQSPSEQGNGPKAKRPDQNAKPDGSEGKAGQPNGKGDKGEQKNGQAGKTGQGKQDGGTKGQGNKGDEGQSAGAPQGQSGAKPGDAGSTPGGGGARGNRRSPAANSPDPSIKSEANPLYQQKAGQLQLENFKKHVTKDVLKKANMTEEEYRKFLQAYEEMLKRKQADPTIKDDKLPNPKSRGGDLNSLRARRVEPKGKDDKVQRNGLALPPPEYRDAYKEFTEKLSDLERSGDKK